MPREILIHAGFHKTATTTLQKTLRVNAAALETHFAVHLRNDLSTLGSASLTYAHERNPVARKAVFETAYQYFQTLDPNDTRPIIFSNESLAGHYIGHPLVQRYGAVHIIAEELHKAWMAAMGSNAKFTIYLSTRRNGWVESCYWERVKRSRERLSLEQFVAKYPDAADHAAAVARVRDAIGGAHVKTAVMEDLAHPLLPVLEHFGKPDLFADLVMPPNQNMRLPQNVYDELLALNRSDLDWPDMRRAKTKLLLSKDPDWEGLW